MTLHVIQQALSIVGGYALCAAGYVLFDFSRGKWGSGSRFEISQDAIRLSSFAFAIFLFALMVSQSPSLQSDEAVDMERPLK